MACLLLKYKSTSSNTIEAIGKYQLISSPPINHYTTVLITHVSRPVFRCESIGTIFKILRVHLHGLDGQIQAEQGGVQHVAQ